MKTQYVFWLASLFGVSLGILKGELSPKRVYFRENKGQVRDQYWRPRWDVLYSGQLGSLVYHLRGDGYSYQLVRVEGVSEGVEGIDGVGGIRLGIHRVDVGFVGGRVRRVVGEEVYEGYENFYNVPVGVEPALYVRRYGRVRYEGVWDGVDMVFYEGSGGLEIDFEVGAWVSSDVIRMRVEGAEVYLRDGELVLRTPYGEVVEGRPRGWSGGREVEVAWVVDGGEVGFVVEGRRVGESLRIDPPVRVWGTYYGGGGSESHLSGSIALGNSGAIYMTGHTTSTTNIATAGAHQSTFSGLEDVFLAKFTKAGVLIWGTYYGGTGEEESYFCTVDANENIYITGYTSSSLGGIATPGAHQVAFGGAPYDAFLAKFSSLGLLQWGTYYGGTDRDAGYACAVDKNGDIYLVGTTRSHSGIATVGSHQPTFGGGLWDAFLVKFTPSGGRVWGTYYGGTGVDNGIRVAVDGSGQVYLGGYTYSTTHIATPGTHQPSFSGGAWADCFIAKFSGLGVRLWGTYYGSTGHETLAGCVVDEEGDLYIVANAGAFSTGLATPGGHQTSGAGNYDGLIARFGGGGNLIWGTYYGGASNDFVTELAVRGGALFVAGYTQGSSTNIATPGAFQVGINGGEEAFLVRFCKRTGMRIWGTYYGGEWHDNPWGCAADDSGNVYLSGITASTMHISTPGAHSETYQGLSDAFLVRFYDSSAARVRLRVEDSLTRICGSGGTGFVQLNGQYGSPPYEFSVIPSHPTWQANGYFSNLAPGVYTLRVRDACGGVDTQQITIQSVGKPSLNVVDSLSQLCAGVPHGFVQLQGSGGSPPYQYSILPIYPAWQSSGYFGNLPPGTYILQVRDTNGCTESRSFTVQSLLPIQISLMSVDTIPCHGGTGGFTVEAIGGGGGPFTYTLNPSGLSNSSGVFTGLPAGNYIVQVTSASGCTDSFSVTLGEPPSLGIVVVDSAVVTCQGENGGAIRVIGIGGTPPYTYRLLPNYPSWQSHGSFGNLSPGSYSVEVQDRKGCLASYAFTVQALPAIQLQVISLDTIRCHGGRGGVTVQAQGGAGGPFSYELYPTGQVSATGHFVGLAAGVYKVRAWDQTGCSDSLQITLSEPLAIDTYGVAIHPVSCREALDGEIRFSIQGGTPPYTFLWMDGGGSPLNFSGTQATGLGMGSYTVLVTDRNGCIAGPYSYLVGIAPTPAFPTLSYRVEESCPNQKLRVTVSGFASAPVYIWIWEDGRRDTTQLPAVERTYELVDPYDVALRVELWESNGCKRDTVLRVRLIPCAEVLIPTVFSPNADGINDIWQIRAVGWERYSVFVYDRWGKQIWDNGGDPTRMWDGRNVQGREVPEGAYVYYFRGTDRQGREQERTGTVTLLR
ncbi:MAG: gliding motility-associated C-terminal domain-containing protein [Bacteroidia bacterium]|nr:gliding motility-associated C-terminal domain-containing protein [Bacteroidia bacterium]